MSDLLFDYLKTQRISVISLAGKVDKILLNNSIDFFEKKGINVNIMPHVYDENSSEFYFSSNIENRLNDLYQAWDSSDIIICSRGGYGSCEVANLVNWDYLRKNNKVKLIGYSDITAFHMAMLNNGVGIPISGMMFLKFPELSKDNFNSISLYNALNNKVIDINSEVTMIKGDKIPKKEVVVANLTMLVSLCGTKFFPNLKDKILIIEDINEPIYKLDRSLNQLYQIGVFKDLSALIFGEFFNCGNQIELNKLILKFTNYLNGVVAKDFPFGHNQKVYAINMKNNSCK